MGQWLQRLVANTKYGAVSDATIQGYLRAASQLEDVWQQIDDKVDELLLQGLPPWEAYSSMGYALAFIRACRMNVIFVQGLLKAEATASTTSAGYLPKITYDQALALCEQIEPTIEEAIKASSNPQYVLPTSAFPLSFGPHVGGMFQSFPLSHLQGIIGAGQAMKDWTAGLLAKYELALHAAKEPVPQEVSTHLEQMKSELELGNFHLRTGVDLVGQLSQGQAAEELLRKAEGLLWEAMESFYRVSQMIAMPGARRKPAQRVPVETNQAPAPRQSEASRIPQQSPEMNTMLDQVIAGPTPVQRMPARSALPLDTLLKVVGAGLPPEQNTPSPSAPDVAGLLDLGKPVAESAQPVPNASPPDMTGLLHQDPAQGPTSRSSAKESKTVGGEAIPRQSTSEAQALDLLAEICGEQEQSTEE